MNIDAVRELLPDFDKTFFSTPEGRSHMAWFPAGRKTARANYEDVVQRARAGEDVTDLVLTKLLPHLDSPFNRERGAWLCIAPVITRDIKQWFEGVGWARAGDWPKVSALILSFLRTVIENPSALAEQCDAFRSSPHSKGLQVAFLTPILNAIRPDVFCLVNSKTTRAMRHLVGVPAKSALRLYPQLNEKTIRVISALAPDLPRGQEGVLPCDVFDAFCHWWVTTRQLETSDDTGDEDTGDELTAEALFTKFYPDSQLRIRVLELLASTIEAAHGLAEGCWEITARRRRIRLNVGSIVALEFTADSLRIGLVPADVPSDLRDQLEQDGRWGAEFSTDPPVRLCRFAPLELSAQLPKIAPAHAEYVRIAVETGRNSPYRRFHSPAVVVYAEEVLKKQLPRPSYAETSPRKTSSSAGARAQMDAAVHFRAPQALFNRVEYTIDHLVSSIEIGEIGLPELQRPFVWDRTKVRDLFDSMYRGFPVGFLMFWSNTQMLPARAIGADRKQVAPTYLVVDGQQRLTSLYAVFKGTTVVDEDFKESRIELAFRPRDSRFAVSDAAIKRDPEYIPNISDLWADGFGERRFVNAFLEKLKAAKDITRDDEDAIAENISRLINLKGFQLTALVIRPEIQEESVADIFVRINNQGVKLEQADFILTMLSVFWPDGRKQLEAFSKASRLPPSPGTPSPFNYIIQPGPDQMLRATIALGFHRGRLRAVYQILRGRDPETGLYSPDLRSQHFDKLKAAQPYVLNLNDWHAYLHTLRTAGYLGRDSISSENTVIFSYALYLIAKHQCEVPEPDLSRAIRCWFFVSTLTGRYTGSVESTMDEDLAELREAHSPEEFTAFTSRVISTALTGDFWKVSLPASLGTSSSNAPGLLTFWASQSILNAPVLFSDKRVRDLLDPALRPAMKAIEVHHLFPRDWLRQRGITSSRRINQVANLTFLEWPQNRSLSSLPPSDYVPRLKDKFSSSQWQTMLQLHALPERWETMEYEHFLEARRPLMAGIIKQAYETLSVDRPADGYTVLDAAGEERTVWPLIEQVERLLRQRVREKYAQRWSTGADAQIKSGLGEQAIAVQRNREKHASAYNLSPTDASELLDYCYLGQLGQLMTSNAAWGLFQDAFRDKRELEDLLRYITPVRNDLAHFRRVPQHELDRCRIAAVELVRKLESPSVAN